MPERFFIGNSVRGCSTSEQLSLLCGPPACGKTSLLFQFAFNCAAESGGKVVFICSKKRLEHKPPFLPQDIDPASDILGRIQMKYVEDDVEIKKYFAAFHLHERFPVAVIIDDFGDFFIKGKYQDKYGPRDREAALAHALALCQNAISHANSKLQPCGSCKLLLSDTQRRDNASLLFIYKIWMQSIFIIEDSFFLKNMANQRNWPTRRRIAKYNFACQYLILEEVLEE
ncbi:uncharacterized protein LOC110017837 isoform X2 [Phalaenopsis equestris]|uniref:uncharacterized protein LOC110017837 isoform X2 n=1 Tax=Phalaenopsis equestris TaxID=78828 RepID=UPI0009E2ADE7|nr:uncharacterized protein LOC110017837 isoform X2 [Phalaenopsis equestris]